LPLREAVIKSVRISEGGLFLPPLDEENRKARLISAVYSLAQQIKRLPSPEKEELADDVERLNSELETALRSGDGSSLFMTQLSALQQRL
jgi:hypothetical protein